MRINIAFQRPYRGRGVGLIEMAPGLRFVRIAGDDQQNDEAHRDEKPDDREDDADNGYSTLPSFGRDAVGYDTEHQSDECEWNGNEEEHTGQEAQ